MAQIVSVLKVCKAKKSNILLEIIEEPINSDMYTITRSPYISSEFIPYGLIPTIMNHHFPSSELILPYSEKHGVYKITIKDLLVDRVKNWEYNRPPDMARCPDIARYIYNSRKPVDTMLYLTFTNIKEVFEVLDGIHRLTALKIINEENSKPINLLEPCEFRCGTNTNVLFNQYLLVNVRFNATQGELIEAFKNLNKSQVVPELYIRDHSREKRDTIDSIANEWYVRYKRHFSSSSNPNTGNTNRNKFVELLDKLYDKHKICDSSINKLRKKLDEANISLMNSIPTKASLDVRVKCKETGCFLFLYKNDNLEKVI